MIMSYEEVSCKRSVGDVNDAFDILEQHGEIVHTVFVGSEDAKAIRESAVQIGSLEPNEDFLLWPVENVMNLPHASGVILVGERGGIVRIRFED